MSFEEELKKIAGIVDAALAISGNDKDSPSGQSVSAHHLIEWAKERDRVIAQLGQSSEVAFLKERFALDQTSVAVLLLAALPVLRWPYQSVYGVMQGFKDAAPPTLDFLLTFIAKDSQHQRQMATELLNGTNLLRWRLLVPARQGATILEAEVHPAKDVLAYFKGSFRPESDLNGCVHQVPAPPHAVITDPVMTPALDFDPTRPQGRAVHLYGPPGVGRRTLAQQAAAQQAQALYEITGEDLWKFAAPYEVLVDLLRFLTLQDAVLYWPQGLSILASHPRETQLIAAWLELPGNRLFFSSEQPAAWPLALAPLHPRDIALPVPLPAQNAQIWESFARAYGPISIEQVDWQQVGAQSTLLPAAMLQVCLKLNQYPSEPRLDTQRVLRACLAESAASLANVAVRSQPRWSLSDLVVATETRAHLHDIVHQVRLRHRMQKAGVISNLGVKALFWGPPGTGKTMAAEALAQELQRPLYKADLAQIASKWIGETEKHLAALFAEAQRAQAVLFVDEADALFAKRTQVQSHQDKNTNMGVSFLLQCLETYESILVLATNYRDNLDPAFFRRFQFSIPFRHPEVAEREQLWRTVWAPGIRISPAMDIPGLARMFPLNGSQIANIARHASLLSMLEQEGATVEIHQHHLTVALQREYHKDQPAAEVTRLLAQWQQETPPTGGVSKGEAVDFDTEKRKTLKNIIASCHEAISNH